MTFKKMVGIIFFLLLGVELMHFTAANPTDAGCNISGSWRNELNSTVDFIASDGTLSGKYKSAVGKAGDVYTLLGRYTIAGPDCILGFTVAWNNKVKGNSYSTTSWTGVYSNAAQKIITKWILTKFTKPENMWENSYIGMDTFSRI